MKFSEENITFDELMESCVFFNFFLFFRRRLVNFILDCYKYPNCNKMMMFLDKFVEPGKHLLDIKVDFHDLLSRKY